MGGDFWVTAVISEEYYTYSSFLYKQWNFWPGNNEKGSTALFYHMKYNYEKKKENAL